MKNKKLLIGGAGAILAAAAAFFFLKKKKADAPEKPPKNAPQLDIENPGTQSEFPTSATESDVG